MNKIANYARLVGASGTFEPESGPNGDVASPCISVCRMEGAVCTGCLRTLDEIRDWSQASPALRRDIWQRIGARAAAALSAQALPEGSATLPTPR